MKSRVLRMVLATILCGMVLPVSAQKSYYVVVGAFSTEGNAEELLARLPKNSSDTAYAMNDENLVHLYVLKTNDAETAASKSMRLQKSIEELKSNEQSSESIMLSKVGNEKVVAATEIVSVKETMEASASRGPSYEADAAIESTPGKVKTNLYKFTIADSRGNVLPGNIHFVDYGRKKDVAAYSAYTYTDIVNPRSSDVEVVCGVFGYKEKRKKISYENPGLIEGAYRDDNGAWVVPYELERLERGDVSVMYNVAFHKDAVVMLPPSRNDLEELVKMMKENPEYEITIHGHANGKHERKIMAMGDKNYFEVKSTKEFVGTAKELSDLRASAIRQYLVDNGIDERRIRTYAWGGRYKLVEPTDVHARLNDRIEIEIRKD